MNQKGTTGFQWWLALAGTAALCSLTLAGCNAGVPLTAPEGATLQISANPTAIPVQNGVSTITVLGFKGATDGGGPLPDGTQIFFTTNVGTIEERVETKNGIAHAFLRSNGRAGLAAVTAASGQGITASLGAPVLIGNATGINILVVASPSSVGPPDFTSEIIATVFDNDNNTMSDVPLIFSTNAGALASAGAILRTNTQGQARDRLTLRGEDPATVTVSSGSVSATVSVNRGTSASPAISSLSPSSGSPGSSLTVTIRGQNFQPGPIVSFGPGISVGTVTYVNSQTLLVAITIEASAATGDRSVTVTNATGGTSAGFTFRVVANPIITGVSPASGAVGAANLVVTINGANFQAGASVSFGAGIAINSVVFNSATQLTVTITISGAAAVGPRTVTVTNPDGRSGSFVNGFTVT
jgi:hypothetical protein